jgi:hypothetical protein
MNSYIQEGKLPLKSTRIQQSDPAHQVETLNRKPQQINTQTVTQLQRTLGNAAVQRMLAQRSADGAAELDDNIASAIQSERGGGHELEGDIASRAGSVMGADFSGVNIHTDSTADNLSRSVGAKAFTTGNDIFFREGAYNPSSSDGQHLIAHELTHVVQQGASAPAVQGKMTVNDPDDQYEAEADSVADSVMRASLEDVQMQEEEEEALQMQEEEEEEMTM